MSEYSQHSGLSTQDFSYSFTVSFGAYSCFCFCSTVTEMIFTSGFGLSPGPVGETPSLSTTSVPFITLPKTVCRPSNHGVPPFFVTIKNCEPFVFGPELAIDSAYCSFLCGLFANSSGNL